MLWLGVVALFALFKRFNGSPWIAMVIPALPLIVLGFLRAIAVTGVASAFNRNTPGQNLIAYYAREAGYDAADHGSRRRAGRSATASCSTTHELDAVTDE